MAERLRAVVVGPGFIGLVHADALRRNGVEVVGFVGSGSETGRERAEVFGTRLYGSLAEALAAGPVDCVHIATPNHLHAPLAEEAIAAGKHVVCEKPLAMNVAEGERLLDLALSAGIVHAVNFNFRFYTLVRQMRAMVEAIHRIGRVMGKQTIAESVETPAIREALTAVGVDYGQGYGIAMPAPFAVDAQDAHAVRRARA